MRLEGDPQDDQRGDRDQGAEQCDRLRKPGPEQEGGDEEGEPGAGQTEQHQVFGTCGKPPAQSGTSSASSQPPPTSLLIWVAKTRESLSTAPGGPSA